MKVLRWMTLIAGILLIILGCITLGTPVANLVAISVYMCAIVLVYGLLMVFSYFSFNKKSRSAWLLVVGILSALLGGWMLFSGRFVGLIPVLPVIFAMWLLVSSISFAVGSIDLKNYGVRGWGWHLALGILGVILGIILLFDPISAALTVSFSLALAFIYRGISDIVFFFTTRSMDSKES